MEKEKIRNNKKECLTNILTFYQTLGTRVFGFLFICSFAVVLGACGSPDTTEPTEPTEPTDTTDTDGDSIADTNDLCMTSQNTSFTSNSNNDTDRDGCEDAVEDVDDNGNGLIEITTEAMLDNMRYNPMGTSYDDEEQDDPNVDPNADEGDKTGCGGGVDTEGNDIITCNGYELSNDITLMEDWPIITEDFTGTFDGKGFSISGLIISSGNVNVGFFARVSGTVRDIHLTGTSSVTSTHTPDSSSNSVASLGSLVGLLEQGAKVWSSSSTLSIIASDTAGSFNNSAGLVGFNNRGTIRNSYATGNVNGGDEVDFIGGLVGRNDGTIHNSYATGNINGDNGDDRAGGLVGDNRGSIRNSYATGNVNGSGGGNNNRIGSLVGQRNQGTTQRSYRNSQAVLQNGRDSMMIGIPKTVAELQAGTDVQYTGWSTNDWDFGTSSEYPALRSYKKDGSEEGDLLCGQLAPRAQCP